MTDIYSPTKHKQPLFEFLQALEGQWKTLRKDECGDWRITGKWGNIYAVPGVLKKGLDKTEGFQLYVQETSARAWGFCKKEMCFCVLLNDGDDKGMFFLDRLPTPNQANVIRGRLGIKKRKTLSEDQLAALKRHGENYRFQRI